jgi:hypothetical protein
MLVRGVDYTIDDGRENPTTYRLFTTLTDPGEVTATELAETYAPRWEIELAFDELKTTSAARARCCVPSRRTLSCKKSGDTSAATTRSVP